MAISTGPGPEVMSAESLIGDKVVNTLGEDLGKIEEIMIDMDSGQVNYAVLSFGGLFGIGDKLFAIPWKLLRLDSDNKQFICDIPKDKLERAPGFDKDNWPRMGDRDWGREVHTYYGQEPYWERSGTVVGTKKETGREYHH